MVKINFNGKKVNFWEIALFSNKHPQINYAEILHSAFNQKALIVDENVLLEKFINYILQNKIKSKSQLFQDIFASFIINEDFEKKFLEFGATNGIDLSNTYILEKELNWEGVLAEPSPQWHKELIKNRPKSRIIKECIWKSSGDTLEFFVSKVGALSTLKNFVESDIKSMPGNTKLRKEAGEIVRVNTISLNDVIKNYFNNICPSYISIDTEGSEYEILSSFDFKKYKPIFFSIEHNFTDLQIKIDNLMKKNDYSRIFNKATAFDAWYIYNKKMVEL